MPRPQKAHQKALDWIFTHVFAPLLAFILHALCRSIRWEVRGLENLRPYWGAGKPVIVGCWHGRLLMIPYAWYKHGAGETYVLMGLNRNGELITRIVERFRMKAVRGGSRKGGEEARKLMADRVLADPRTTLSMTPDGPHGPRYVSKPGMAALSRQLELPVIWVTASAMRSIRFGTWDRFMLPLPFTRVIVEFSPAILPADHAAKPFDEYKEMLDEAGREHLRRVDGEMAGLSAEDSRILDSLAHVSKPLV